MLHSTIASFVIQGLLTTCKDMTNPSFKEPGYTREEYSWRRENKAKVKCLEFVRKLMPTTLQICLYPLHPFYPLYPSLCWGCFSNQARVFLGKLYVSSIKKKRRNYVAYYCAAIGSSSHLRLIHGSIKKPYRAATKGCLSMTSSPWDTYLFLRNITITLYADSST